MYPCKIAMSFKLMQIKEKANILCPNNFPSLNGQKPSARKISGELEAYYYVTIKCEIDFLSL